MLLCLGEGDCLVSHEMMMQLIEATTTRAGLTVNIKLDKTQYRTNLKVSAEGMAFVNLERHAFHREWHYTFEPSQLYVPSDRRPSNSGLARLAAPFTPDWLVPLNQPASLPA